MFEIELLLFILCIMGLFSQAHPSSTAVMGSGPLGIVFMVLAVVIGIFLSRNH